MPDRYLMRERVNGSCQIIDTTTGKPMGRPWWDKHYAKIECDMLNWIDTKNGTKDPSPLQKI